MTTGVDWTHRGEYVLARHQVTPDQADEALADPNRLVIDPDFASRSGRSIRVIGWSQTLGQLLTVIVVEDEGTFYGANAWKANTIDQRHYQEDP